MTDLYRQTESYDSLKGVFAIYFWFICLVCAYLLLRADISRIRWFALGAACSSILVLYAFRPGSWTRGGDPSQFTPDFRTAYVGVFANWLSALALIFYAKHPRLVIIAYFALAAICILNGSRSAAATLALVGVLTIYYRTQSHHRDIGSNFRPGSTRRFGVLILLTILLVGLISYAYQYAALNNYLGDKERQRYIEQSDTDVGILGARSPVFAGMLAIIDSPFLGHGSWAKDDNDYAQRGADLIGEKRGAEDSGSDTLNLIPCHSCLVGAWVWHGVFGGLFWIYTLIFLIRFFARYTTFIPEYLPYTLFKLWGFFWSILFSPFGQRSATAFALVFLIVIAERAELSLRGPNLVHFGRAATARKVFR